MKRNDHLYESIMRYDNLRLAFEKARKGKRERPDVIEYARKLEFKIRKLQHELADREPDIGHYRFFTVRDPKIRRICAASFPERVLHHGVMNICEPVIDAYAIHDSYACRKGKGAQKGIKRAQKFSRGHDWYLKMDVRKYFDSIDHTVMMRLLGKRIKDDDLLYLFWRILETYHTAPGKGMPIGNLISQHLANFYLGCFDHWIKEERRIRGYLRYMDDFLLFGEAKQDLKKEILLIERFLAETLELELKPVQLNRCRKGIPFLGYRVFPDRIWLSARSKRRFIRKFIDYEAKWVNGEWTIETLTQHMEPLIEFTRFANASAFRGNVIERYGVPY